MPNVASLFAILVAMAMMMPPAYAMEGAQARPNMAAASATVSTQPRAAPAADAGKSAAAAQAEVVAAAPAVARAPGAEPLFLLRDFDEQPLFSAFVFVGTLIAAMTIFGRIRRDDPPPDREWHPAVDVKPVSRDAPPATRVDGG